MDYGLHTTIGATQKLMLTDNFASLSKEITFLGRKKTSAAGRIQTRNLGIMSPGFNPFDHQSPQ